MLSKVKSLYRKLFGRKPKHKANLVFAFTDHAGNHYYKYHDDTLMPVGRIAIIQKFITEATRGLTKDELYRLLDIADNHIASGLTNPKNAAKVSAIIHEIRLREELINNEVVYLNYLASIYIRYDEDPNEFNIDIQKEKVEAFRKASRVTDEKSSFFFHLPEYAELCKSLNITTGNWSDVTRLSEMMDKRKRKAEEILK